MAEESKEQAVDQDAADPYDGVALGVECAWPQTFPAAEATSLAALDTNRLMRIRLARGGESFRFQL